MRTAWKAASIGATIALLGGAAALGGGTPLPPDEIAAAASDAARNVSVAARATDRAARNTEALATISRNVASQLESSKRLLETQLAIEDESRTSARYARLVARRIEDLDRALALLRRKLGRLTGPSNRAAASTEDGGAAASSLRQSLNRLMGRFDVVVEESRELNRKARGYDKVKDGP